MFFIIRSREYSQSKHEEIEFSLSSFTDGGNWHFSFSDLHLATFTDLFFFLTRTTNWWLGIRMGKTIAWLVSLAVALTILVLVRPNYVGVTQVLLPYRLATFSTTKSDNIDFEGYSDDNSWSNEGYWLPINQSNVRVFRLIWLLFLRQILENSHELTKDRRLKWWSYPK